MASPLVVHLLAEPLSICRLAAEASMPTWAETGPFCSVTRTADELSVICASDRVPPEVLASDGWRAFKLAGPFAFSEIGVLLRVAQPLAAAGVSIMPVATYDTDYVLVRTTELEAAVIALRDAGHDVRDAS